MNILIIQTDYPHWGKYSGFNQFVKFLDRNRFNIEIYNVQDGDQDFPIQNRYLRYFLRNYVQGRSLIWEEITWYKLSDLVAEIKTFISCLHKRIDIIHFLDAEHSALYLPKLLRALPKRRPKLIATYHQHPEILNSAKNKDLIPMFDLITTVSHEQIPFFHKYTSPNNIELIHHGINVDFFRPGNNDCDNKKFRCITLGHWQRDFKTMREVCKSLSNHKKIEFHLVPSIYGPAQTGLEDLNNVIIHRDKIDDYALLELYQQSDVLFLPLLRATANNSLLEGIACGLPVVSSLLPSVKAYVPGEEAILIKDSDPVQFSRAILHLCHNKNQRNLMGKEARRRAEELDWRNITPKYESIYKNLISYQ